MGERRKTEKQKQKDGDRKTATKGQKGGKQGGRLEEGGAEAGEVGPAGVDDFAAAVGG